MKPIGNNFSSDIGRFLSVFTRSYILYFLVITIFFPLTNESLSFSEWHNAENISDECVNTAILDQGGRMLFGLVQIQNSVLKCRFEKNTQPIIFSSTDGKNPTIDCDQSSNNRNDQCGRKCHRELFPLSAAIGFALGGIIAVLIAKICF